MLSSLLGVLPNGNRSLVELGALGIVTVPLLDAYLINDGLLDTVLLKNRT